MTTQINTELVKGGARGEVRFVGLPSGYEFPTFIDSIIDASRGKTSH